jgi:hypothetical protein
MDAHEDAYYRHRIPIISFHRAIRVLSSSMLALYVNDHPGVPAPILGGGGGGSGRELARVLIFRGGLPLPWIAVLNFPLPFPMQARGLGGAAAASRAQSHRQPLAPPHQDRAQPLGSNVQPSASPPPPPQCLFQALTLLSLLLPLAKPLVPILQQPELRGAVCRLYLHVQWLMLLPRSRGAAFASIGVGEEGGACPAAAPHLLAYWVQIVLGGIAPLAVAYFMEARAKERFLDSLRPRREGSRTQVLGHALLFFGTALLGATLAAGLAAQASGAP